MSAHVAEMRQPAERCHWSGFPSCYPRPSPLTPLKGNRTCRANQCGYPPGFFPLPSCGETSSSLEDAISGIASAPCLRFSPLEIFAQRQFQPILSWIVSWIDPRYLAWIFCRRPGLRLAFVLVILHRGPVRMHCCRNVGTRENRLMSEIHALASLPQRTLDGWHRFVASGDQDLLASLLAEHIVFRSPFVQSPIPGRTATLLVLTTVVQIFENFRYHRAFIVGFSRCRAGICRQYRQMAAEGHRSHQIQRRRRNDRIRGHDPADQGAAGAGRGDGEPDRPATEPAEAGRSPPALMAAPFEGLAGSRALARSGALWQGSARLVGAFSGRFSYPGTLP